MRHLLVLSALAITASVATAQFTVVIPNGTAATEGNSSNAFPWGRGSTGLLISTIYDSTNFTAQGINFPIIISRARWRPNTAVTSVASNYPTGATVKLSTCPLDQSQVIAAAPMANYEGADITTVFTGPVSWPAAAATTGPCPFLIDIPFTSNFVYDPTLGGDLNIETDIPIQTFTGTGLQLDVQTTGVLASRIYISTGYPTGATAITTSHGVVCELTYTPATGLYAGFSANVTSGASPLTVNFTDRTFTSDPGGVLSWAWDFDGDNVVDSTAQNPTFVYNGCGNFNVSLTVTDATHPQSTLTRTGFIRTDDITASFTSALLAPPNVFQFTDTSTPAATSWDWDFNNDGITDSTAQNPVAVLPMCSSATVRLIATRNCKSNTKTQNIFLSPFNLPTLYTGGNGGASLWTVYMDAQVTNPQGINICGLGLNSSTAANTAFTLDLYVTQDSYVGKHFTPAEWRLAGTASGTTAGTNLVSTCGFPTSIYLPPGNYGIAMRYNGLVPTYTNGTGTATPGTGTNQTYTSPDVTLLTGGAGVTTAAPFTGTTLNTPRVWNGTLFYDTAGLGGAATAGYGFFGKGCAGTLGVSNLNASSRPQLGATLSVSVNNVPASVAIMMLGFSKTFSNFGPLPLDLTIVGAPNCFGRVSPDATALLFGFGNTATWNFNIPNTTAYTGQVLYNQALVLDPGFNGLGGVVSDATGMMIGN